MSRAGAAENSLTWKVPSEVMYPSFSTTTVQGPPSRPPNAQRPFFSVTVGSGPASGRSGR